MPRFISLRTAVRVSVTVTATTLLIQACGGGGDDGPGAEVAATPTTPATPPTVRDFGLQGAVGGTLTGTNAQDIIVVVDANGSLWGVYGTGAANDFKVTGLLTGSGGGNPTTTSYRWDATDWGRPGNDASRSPSVRIDLSLDLARPAMSGTVTSATDTRTIAGGALPADGYQPTAAATLDTVRGHWELTTSGGRPLSIDIAADGRISGMSGLCAVAFGSAIKPGASGSNIFALEMHFNPASRSCSEPFAASDGVYGFALAYAPIGGGLQLVIGALNGWDPVYLTAAGKR